jgi:hypothetical protein
MIERIVISSGHGKYIRGASGILDEVDEARRVVEELAEMLQERGIEVIVYHDDVSTTQNENLNRIVDFHNSQTRDLDMSVHFNAYVETEKAMGTEVLYVSQKNLAASLSQAIASVGFLNRGAKVRDDLFFLNSTEMPSVLLEVCFVDSEADAAVYRDNFSDICDAIADVFESDEDQIEPPRPPKPEPEEPLFSAVGPCSEFGGPDDEGVSAEEGLAFISDIEQAPQLFLPFQPAGTAGLARRLNPFVHYVACRWDYDVTPKAALLEDVALVRATKTGIALKAFPADWGPHEKTGRVADLSPGLLDDLGLETDDEVEVIFPYREE